MTAPGQADEYTPSTTEAQVFYSCGKYGDNSASGQREFQRFLAARDRAVREAALEEVAAHLEKPGMLWWNSAVGATVYDDGDHLNSGRKPTELMVWLRARAAANQTGEQKHD